MKNTYFTLTRRCGVYVFAITYSALIIRYTNNDENEGIIRCIVVRLGGKTCLRLVSSHCWHNCLVFIKQEPLRVSWCVWPRLNLRYQRKHHVGYQEFSPAISAVKPRAETLLTSFAVYFVIIWFWYTCYKFKANDR